MIIAKIHGGLGNQLFQYAAAKSLACKHNVEFKLDITDFKEDKLRKFELEAFHTNIVIASYEEINTLKAFNSFERVIARLTPYPKKKFYKETHFHFDKKFLSLGPEVYIRGYFQSEEYFKPINLLIREDFSIKESVMSSIKDIAKELAKQASVSIHIRRGDYENEAGMKYHGLQPLSYYLKAINLIKEKISDPRFYIFSDDKNWAINTLELSDPDILKDISGNQFEDFYLMSQCRHNIIANSSFSWWAAWLNKNAEKIVIAPNKWFNKAGHSTEDLLPDDWIRL